MPSRSWPSRGRHFLRRKKWLSGLRLSRPFYFAKAKKNKPGLSALRSSKSVVVASFGGQAPSLNEKINLFNFRINSRIKNFKISVGIFMKNQFFLMIIFCLISNVAYSMSIDLDDESKAKLIEQVKKENVKRGYWPSDVAVRLEQFDKMRNNNGSDIRYFVRAVGFYDGYVQVNSGSDATVLYPVRLGKGTEGSFRKEELESLGVQLPEQKLRDK